MSFARFKERRYLRKVAAKNDVAESLRMPKYMIRRRGFAKTPVNDHSPRTQVSASGTKMDYAAKPGYRDLGVQNIMGSIWKPELEIALIELSVA